MHGGTLRPRRHGTFAQGGSLASRRTLKRTVKKRLLSKAPVGSQANGSASQPHASASSRIGWKRPSLAQVFAQV